MNAMKDVKAIIRTECVPELLRALERADVARFYLSRVHAVGAGVDPEDFRPSLDQGGLYTEKTKVEFLCPGDRVDELVGIAREWACTGHRGDGVVIISNVTDVVNVRTGAHDRIALL